MYIVREHSFACICPTRSYICMPRRSGRERDYCVSCHSGPHKLKISCARCSNNAVQQRGLATWHAGRCDGPRLGACRACADIQRRDAGHAAG